MRIVFMPDEKGDSMKEKIHPDYHEVKCTGTTKKGDILKVDVCSKCHPFYTGKQKRVETGGRIDKFNKRYANLKK